MWEIEREGGGEGGGEKAAYLIVAVRDEIRRSFFDKRPS